MGGWHDWFVEQTLYQYAALLDRGVDVGLTIGPWAHLSMDPAVSARESLAWLNTHLPIAAADPLPPRENRVRVYVTGARTWRKLLDWPSATTDRIWYLRPDGRLDGDAPAQASATTFRYDPMDPTPSVGGRVLARSAGPRDSMELEARDDVRTLSTPALRKPVEVQGAVRVRLFVESDKPCSDVFVRLCAVGPNGKSVNTTDGLVRLDPAPGRSRLRGGWSRRRCPTLRTPSAPDTGSDCRSPAAPIRGTRATSAPASRSIRPRTGCRPTDGARRISPGLLIESPHPGAGSG
ncbi:CocE/NonD family hydrolase [Blastococcus sp. PRF04-17]|nr:CocE/NonD family hydrolase [Blastococcus sp. PRF04-17]